MNDQNNINFEPSKIEQCEICGENCDISDGELVKGICNKCRKEQ